MTTIDFLARQRKCHLSSVINEQPEVGEMSFVKALLNEQLILASEEPGDTTDFSHGVILRARQKAGIGRPLAREAVLSVGLGECLQTRYLGLCAAGRCVGGDFITEEIERSTESTQTNE